MKNHGKTFMQNAYRQFLYQAIVLLTMLLASAGPLAANHPETGIGICPCFEGYEVGDPDDPNSVTYLSQSDLPQDPNELIGGCVNIYGKLIVNEDYLFDYCEIVMGEGAEIQVQPYKQLTIRNQTVLRGCEYMWRGITLEFQAKLDMEQSTAKDAQYAVQAKGFSKVRLVGNTFDANYVGFYMPPGNQNNVTFPVNDFKDNHFVFQSTYLPGYNGQVPNPNTQPQPYAGILLNNAAAFYLGHPLNGSIKNYFQDLRHGIITLSPIGGRFSGCEMTDIDYTYPEGIGIMVVENVNKITVQNCYMANMTYGVVARKPKGLEIIDNNIEHLIGGVTIVEGGKGSVLIENNLFDGLPLTSQQLGAPTGIAITNCNISSNFSYDIKGNSFLIEALGIGVWNTEGKVNIIEDNTMEITFINPNPAPIGVSVHGVLLSQTGGPTTVKDTHISLSPGAYGNTGIFLIGTKNTHVSENDVSGSNFEWGIVSSVSPDNLYCCNYLQGTDYGVLFNGMCNDTRLKNTDFNNHGTALFLSNSQISPQLNHGNDWVGANASVDAYYIGNPLDISNSVFYTNPALVPNGFAKIYTSPAGYEQDWFMFSGQDPVCATFENCGEQPFEFTSDPNEFTVLTELDLHALEPETSSDPIHQVMKWESQRYLYQKLVNNPALIEWNNEVTVFFNGAQAGMVGQFHEIENGIEGLAGPPASLSTAYFDLLSSIDGLGEDLSAVEIQLLSADETEQTALFQQRADLLDQLGILLDDLNGLEAQVSAWRDNRIAELVAANAAINPATAYQSEEKAMLDIYLQTIAQGDFSFTPAQAQTVDALANQCPAADGMGVLWARGIRQYYAPGWEWAADDCLGLDARSAERPGTVSAKETEVQLSPNPASNQLAVQLAKPLEQEGQLLVYDLTGKLQMQVQLVNGSQHSTVNVSMLTSGVYVCKIMEGGNQLATLRVSVVK